MAEEKKLEQTRGTFQLKGNATQIDRDNAYEEAIRPDGRFAGRTYRKLNIGVQTSPTNQPRLGIFSYEPDKVFLWDNKKREKDPNYKGDRMPYDEYLEQKDILKANGVAVLQSRVGVEYDDDNKLISEGMTNYEATELIYDNLDNGEGIYVEGDISYSKYKNRQDEEVTGVNYNISRLHKAGDDFDLNDDEYRVENYYEQEMVFVDAMADRDNDRLIVIGRIIDYRGNTVDSEFMVNYGEDKDMQKLAKNLKSKFKFGDLMTVHGEIKNETVEEAVETVEDDALAMLGGKAQPSFAKRTNRSYNREMTINGVKAWERKKYTEEDFMENEFIKEADKEESDDLTKELGGKSSAKSDNPFADSGDDLNEDDPFADSDDSDDDLPF